MISGIMTSKVQAIAEKRDSNRETLVMGNWGCVSLCVFLIELEKMAENCTFYDGINFYLNTQQEQQKYISTAIQLLFEEYLLNTDQT